MPFFLPRLFADDSGLGWGWACGCGLWHLAWGLVVGSGDQRSGPYFCDCWLGLLSLVLWRSKIPRPQTVGPQKSATHSSTFVLETIRLQILSWAFLASRLVYLFPLKNPYILWTDQSLSRNRNSGWKKMQRISCTRLRYLSISLSP